MAWGVAPFCYFRYLTIVFLLLARQSLYKFNFVLTRSSVLRDKNKKSAGQINSSSVGTYIFCEKIKYLGGRNVKDVRCLQNFV